MYGNIFIYPEAFNRNTNWVNWRKNLDNYLDTNTGVTVPHIYCLVINWSALFNSIALVTILDV